MPKWPKTQIQIRENYFTMHVVSKVSTQTRLCISQYTSYFLYFKRYFLRKFSVDAAVL